LNTKWLAFYFVRFAFVVLLFILICHFSCFLKKKRQLEEMSAEGVMNSNAEVTKVSACFEAAFSRIDFLTKSVALFLFLFLSSFFDETRVKMQECLPSLVPLRLLT
jgi:hypothetical protein